MEQKRRDLTIEDVRAASYFGRQRLSAWISNAERAFADLDKTERIERHECRWCFYRAMSGGRVGGQAFTARDCDSCGQSVTYSSTNTDRVCRPCAERLGICVSCVADIDLVDRRKLERR